MTSADSSTVDQKFLSNAMASFLQIGALLILLMMCFTIVRPFISIMVWALILAVAIYPLHVSMTARLGGREKASATLFVLIGLAIILVPTWMLGESSCSSSQGGYVQCSRAESRRCRLAGDRCQDLRDLVKCSQQH